MSSKSKKQSTGSRPGMRLRGQLADAYQARGGNKSILWLHYSAKMRKDVVLSSAFHYQHFLYCESDPTIETIDYAPDEQVKKKAGEGFLDIVAVEITLKSGELVWRELAYSKDIEAKAQIRDSLQVVIQHQNFGGPRPRHEVLTEKDIFFHPHRIRNWHRVMPWLARVRDVSLQDHAAEISALLRRCGRIEFRDATLLGDGSCAALYGAALLQGLQKGAYTSDLDRSPFSPVSTFCERES